MTLLNLPIPYRVAATILVFTAIVFVSVIPGRPQPGDSAFVWILAATPTIVQKTLHLIAYALLAALWMWTLEFIDSRAWRAGSALSIAIATGAAMEWLQLSIPGRFGTLGDVILNAAGAISGLLAAILLL